MVGDNEKDEEEEREKAIKQAAIMIQGSHKGGLNQIIYEEDEEEEEEEEDDKDEKNREQTLQIPDIDRLKTKLFSIEVEKLVDLSKLRE